jgi:hypothetical protein
MKLCTTFLASALLSATALGQGPSFDSAGPGPLAQVLFPGETLHYQTTTSGSGSVTITALSAPVGMSVSTGGIVTWTPGQADLGVHEIVLQGSDATGTNELHFSLAVEPEHFSLQLIDYPGADNTQVLGTNHLGQVVGLKSAPSAGVQGFIWDGANFTELKFPGAFWTLPYDINDLGDVVGTNYDTNGWHGFRWSAGTFSPIPYSGYENHPYSSTNAGLTTGWRISSPNSPSFAYTDLGALSFPGTSGTSKLYSRGYGMNELGQAVGDFWQTGVIGRTAFLFDQNLGTTIGFQVPNSLLTSAWGISDNGVIAGTWGSYAPLGYIGPSGELAFYTGPGGPNDFRRLGIPAATGRVHALDVDNSGRIVGRYEYQPEDFHGFIATPVVNFAQADLGGASPGGVQLSISGEPLYSANHANLEVTGMSASAPGLLMIGAESAPLPLAGGSLLVTATFQLAFTATAAGTFSVLNVAGGGGPAALVVQVGVLDLTNPAGFSLSNAVRAVFLP